MGFSCKNKNTLTPTIINYLNRDLGLSNIYNVNSDVSFCMEDFNSPLYYMSGATKPISGIFSACTSGNTVDCDGLYNMSEIDDFNLTFNITGGTDYTGYTGQFCYKIFGRSQFKINDDNTNLLPGPLVLGNGVQPFYQNCVDFSAITSNTINQTILSGADLPLVDNDYRLIDYVIFEPNDCGINIDENFNEIIKVNTWGINQYFASFNFESDWYFSTVINPPTPIFPNPIVDTLSRLSLFTEKLVLTEGQTTYPLKHTVNGGVTNVYVNGVTLTQNYDYYLDFSQSPQGPTVIVFNEQLEHTKDTVSVSYLVGSDDTNLNNQSDLFNIETLIYSASTTGVTATTVNTVNYNPTSGLQEIFLQNNILNGSSVVLTIDGFELTENIGFYKSNSVKNKINLHPNIGDNLKVGDIITIWYFKERQVSNGDLGRLTNNDVDIRWTIPSSIVPSQFNDTYGYFSVEIAEEGNLNYSGTTISSNIDYSGKTSYSKTFIGVPVNKKYIYRVCLNKRYVTITGDEIYTTSCSDNGSFDLTSGQLLYSD